jgi:hypothetical protein
LSAVLVGSFSHPRSIAETIKSVMVNHYPDRQFTLSVAREEADAHIADRHGNIRDFVELGDE